MSENLDPQEQLDIASAVAGRARRAPVMPPWVPPVVGVLGGGAISLVYMGLFASGGIDARPFAAGITLTLLALGLMAWLQWVWKAGGVVPRSPVEQPVQQWKQVLSFVLPVASISVVGVFLGGQTGSLRWMFIPFGMIVGGFLWFGLARRRARSRRS